MPNIFEKELNFEEDFPFTSYEEWEKLAESIYKSAVPLKEYPYENISVKPLYTRNDIYDRPLTFPRGDKNDWQVCQRIEAADEQSFNTALRQAIEGGAQAVEIVLATQTIFAMPKQENRGKVSLNINNYKQFSHCFDDVDLSGVKLLIPAGLSGGALLTFIKKLAEERGLAAENISGAVEIDPLASAARYGYLFPRESLFDEFAAAVRWGVENLPRIKTAGIDTSYLHNGGASAVQETAYSLSTAAEYIRVLLERGIALKDIVKNIRFTFALSSDFYMNVAKLRAMRLLWANLIKTFGGEGEIELHGTVSLREKTLTEPHNNLIRFTLQGISAAIGGCDVITMNDFSTTDEFTRRMARNILLILKTESKGSLLRGAMDGSFFIDNLSREMAEKSWRLFQNIEAEGGWYEALSKNIPQQAIAGTAAKRAQRLKVGEDKLIGVNAYQQEENKTQKTVNYAEESVQFNENAERIFYNDLNKLDGLLKNGKALPEVYWREGRCQTHEIMPVKQINLEGLIV